MDRPGKSITKDSRFDSGIVKTMLTGISDETKKDEKEKTVQRSYYLTQDIIAAIKVRAGLSGADNSEIVRAALTEYLKKELDVVRNIKTESINDDIQNQ